MFRVLLLAVLVALTGCSSGPITKHQATELRASNIAVGYYMKSKRIAYTETVFKGLWNQIEDQDASFEGLWDIDREMSERLAAAFADRGLMAQPLGDVLGAAEYKNFEKAVSRVGFRLGSDTRQPFILDDATGAALKKQGIRYLVVEERSPFSVRANSLYNSVDVRIFGELLLYDVEGQREIFRDPILSKFNVDVGDSARNLESNNLAKLRDVARRSMDESIDSYMKNLWLDKPI